jgi:hypothetical protein
LSKEPELKVSESRVLRRIFGTKWDEMAGGWRKLHNEEFQIFIGRSNKGVLNGRDVKCAWGNEKCIHFSRKT